MTEVSIKLFTRKQQGEEFFVNIGAISLNRLFIDFRHWLKQRTPPSHLANPPKSRFFDKSYLYHFVLFNK
jgi:hypothetical protein